MTIFTNPLAAWLRRRSERKERAIIAALADQRELSGYQLSQATKLHSGSLYPALMRMEQEGKLVSRWGVLTAGRGGNRPRLYRIKQASESA